MIDALLKRWQIPQVFPLRGTRYTGLALDIRDGSTVEFSPSIERLKRFLADR